MGNTVRMRPRDAAGNGRGVDINAQHRVPPGGGSNVRADPNQTFPSNTTSHNTT